MVISVESCLKNDVFYGHLSCKSNPNFFKYIYCKKNGVDIIDVRKTVAAVEVAESFLNNIIRSGGVVLFVAPQKTFGNCVDKIATDLSMPYITKKWPGGLLTNFIMYRNTIKGIENLGKFIDSYEYNTLSKKERQVKKTLYLKKRNALYGVFKMYKVPSAIIVVDVKMNSIAVTEANSRGIPVVGIVDTNSNPDNIDYVVPANDDSLKSVKFILEEITKNIKKSREEYLESAAIERNNNNIVRGPYNNLKENDNSALKNEKKVSLDKKNIKKNKHDSNSRKN